MVGPNTALLDNPSLTVRLATGHNPTRIVIDRYLKLPPTLKLFDDGADTIIINQVKDAHKGRNRYICVPSVDDLQGAMRALWQADIQSVMVEGGPALHRSFIHQRLWDEVRRYVSPQLLHNGIEAAHLAANADETHAFGSDLLHIYRQRPA